MKPLKQIVVIVALMATPLSQSSAIAQTAPQAESFVRSVYALYHTKSGQDSGPDFTGRKAADTLSPDLIRLIQRDIKTTHAGDAGKLDFDPICSCQDATGLQVKELRVAQSDNRTATVAVKLFFGPPSDSSGV